MDLSTELSRTARARVSARRAVAARAAIRRARPPRRRPPRTRDSDEPTLRELAGQAARVLRRQLARRPRPTAARVRHRSLRTLALVALIGVGTVAGASAVWSAALDYRVRVSGPAAPDVRVLEVSLEADGTATLERAPAPRPAGTTAAGPTSQGGGTPGAVAFDGAVLGAVGAGAVLLLGAAVALAVWRRGVGQGTSSDRAEPEDAPDPWAAEDAEDADQRDHDDAPPDDEPEPEDEPGPPDQSVHGDGDAVLADDAPTSPVARGTVPADAGSREPGAGGTDRAGGRLDGPGSWEYAERIFERRRAPRLPVDLPAVLRWRDGERPVTVTELSEGGLRLRLPGPVAVADAARRLRERTPVRVNVDTVHGELPAGAQIAWQRLEGGDLVAGLQFTALSDAATTVLRAVLADATAAQEAPPGG